MVFRIGRYIHAQYLMGYLGLFGLVGWATYYFSEQAPIGAEKIERVLESQLSLENLSLSGVQKSFYEGRTKESLKKLETIDKTLIKIEKNFGVKEYKNYRTNYNDLKASIKSFSGNSNLNVFFLDLNGKISNFYLFVKNRNWRTLTRTSKRSKVRMAERKSFLYQKT